MFYSLSYRATPGVTQLKIGNQLIFSPILYDHLSLIPVFNRLRSLHLLTGAVLFPSNYATKLVERFPSLIHLKLEIYEIDRNTPLLNILLDGLPKLIHLQIKFYEDRSLSNETSFINSVIERRRQAFPHHIYNYDEISVKMDRRILDIYLSGCSICGNITYFI